MEAQDEQLTPTEKRPSAPDDGHEGDGDDDDDDGADKDTATSHATRQPENEPQEEAVIAEVGSNSGPASAEVAKGWASMSRSERKRASEKRRRNEFKDAFDHLVNTLLYTDPGFAQQMEERERLGSVRVHREEYDGEQMAFFNRVELINQTIFSLERLKRENGELVELEAKIKQGDKAARRRFEKLIASRKQQDETSNATASFHQGIGPIMGVPNSQVERRQERPNTSGAGSKTTGLQDDDDDEGEQSPVWQSPSLVDPMNISLSSTSASRPDPTLSTGSNLQGPTMSPASGGTGPSLLRAISQQRQHHQTTQAANALMAANSVALWNAHSVLMMERSMFPQQISAHPPISLVRAPSTANDRGNHHNDGATRQPAVRFNNDHDPGGGGPSNKSYSSDHANGKRDQRRC